MSDVEKVLADVLNEVTEEGRVASEYWSPDVIRLLAQKGYSIVRDTSEDDASTHGEVAE